MTSDEALRKLGPLQNSAPGVVATCCGCDALQAVRTRGSARKLCLTPLAVIVRIDFAEALRLLEGITDVFERASLTGCTNGNSISDETT